MICYACFCFGTTVYGWLCKIHSLAAYMQHVIKNSTVIRLCLYVNDVSNRYIAQYLVCRVGPGVYSLGLVY